MTGWLRELPGGGTELGVSCNECGKENVFVDQERAQTLRQPQKVGWISHWQAGSLPRDFCSRACAANFYARAARTQPKAEPKRGRR